MGQVDVVIMDNAGTKEQSASLPDDKPVQRILEKLVPMMKLPSTNPAGERMSYRLHHKRSGKMLKGEQTLGSCSVQNGDILRLQAEIIAGMEG